MVFDGHRKVHPSSLGDIFFSGNHLYGLKQVEGKQIENTSYIRYWKLFDFIYKIISHWVLVKVAHGPILILVDKFECASIIFFKDKFLHPNSSWTQAQHPPSCVIEDFALQDYTHIMMYLQSSFSSGVSAVGQCRWHSQETATCRVHTYRIHVWYMYLHLPWTSIKCRWIYRIWIPWDRTRCFHVHNMYVFVWSVSQQFRASPKFLSDFFGAWPARGSKPEIEMVSLSVWETRPEKLPDTISIGSMYGIFTCIYQKDQPDVGIYISFMDAVG